MEPVSGGNGELSRAPNNWPRATAAVISRCKGAMKTLEFDPTEVDGDDLLNLALEIFLEANVHEGLGIETEKLKRFILAVHDRMLDNPYHNWVRAFDALQTSYALLCLSKERQRLAEAEVFGLLIAALCYDLEHPGVNSQFLVKSKSSLATLYNHNSFLEKHHAFRVFELMLHPSVDLLAAVPKDQYVSFRHLVMTLILSTDMARHEEFMLQLNKSSDGGGGLDSLLYMQLILKCADMADPMKPFPVFAKWAVRMTDELFLQGDMERASGMEVSAVCDRICQSRVAVIKGIVDYIVEPFCRLLGRALPALSASFERIPVNRALWDPYDDAKLLQEAGKKDNAQISPLSLRVASWNIAAVNNNPFEYWVTHGQTYQSEGYAKLMTDVQTLIDAPGSRDFKVCEVITDDMMGEVIQALTGHGCNGVEDLMHVWRTEYKERYAISGFLKDKAIGSKRLISMPDRISNTINSEGLVLMRPSVISMFNDVGMKTTAGWWALWKQYMFHTQVILSLPPSFPYRLPRVDSAQCLCLAADLLHQIALANMHQRWAGQAQRGGPNTQIVLKCEPTRSLSTGQDHRPEQAKPLQLPLCGWHAAKHRAQQVPGHIRKGGEDEHTASSHGPGHFRWRPVAYSQHAGPCHMAAHQGLSSCEPGHSGPLSRPQTYTTRDV